MGTTIPRRIAAILLAAAMIAAALLASVSTAPAPAASGSGSGDEDCGAFTVIVNGITFRGDQQREIRGPIASIQVRGEFIDFDVDPSTFSVKRLHPHRRARRGHGDLRQPRAGPGRGAHQPAPAGAQRRASAARARHRGRPAADADRGRGLRGGRRPPAHAPGRLATMTNTLGPGFTYRARRPGQQRLCFTNGALSGADEPENAAARHPHADRRHVARPGAGPAAHRARRGPRSRTAAGPSRHRFRGRGHGRPRPDPPHPAPAIATIHRVRVIAGRYGGRTLQAPRGADTRPTADRVREALFSILDARRRRRPRARPLRGLGRAGHRGALARRRRGHLRGVLAGRAARPAGQPRRRSERPPTSAAATRCRFLGTASRDARQYDLVFLDPPYRLAEALGPELSEALPAVLAPGAAVVAESDRRAPLAIDLPLNDERRYGDTLIRIHGPR